MAVLTTIYESATGRPVYEGFGSDPRQGQTGYGQVQTQIPPLEQGGGLPVCGIQKFWIIDGLRAARDQFPMARLVWEGLTATLEQGHLFGEIHALVEEADSHTFDSPSRDTAVALDAAQDPQGAVRLLPYQWDPEADPPQTKGDPPQDWSLVATDLLRGILPAGALSLAELRGEE